MKTYFDIQGDGGSRVLEQVQARQQGIERNLAGVRWRIAVGSGKGGVGKSTLTLQLARALRRAGRRVAVLDADVNGPSQARLAGVRDTPFVPGLAGLVPPRSAEGIGVVSLGGVVPESESVEFDSVAAGESHTWRATREFTAMAELLGAVEWGELDALLIDLPPGAERTLQYAEFLGPSVAFVLVTIPSDLSRGVVARSVAALARTPNRVLGYVENMSGYFCADCGEVKPLFPAGDPTALGLERLGSVPFDPLLAAAGDRGAALPDEPGRPSVRALSEVAARVLDALEGVP